MPQPVRFQILAESAEAVGGIDRTSLAFKELGGAAKKAALDAQTTARLQVEELVAQRRELRANIATYKTYAATAVKGSEEQTAALKLARAEASRLAATYDVVAASARRSGAAAALAGREHSAAAAKASRRAEESGLLRGAASRSGLAEGSMLAFAGKGFIAGAVAGFTIDYAVKAAIEEQKANANLANALKATGNAREEVRKRTEDFIISEENLTGFQREQVTQTLSQLIRSTGSLTKARKDEVIMADIARARQTDLSGAMMLVLKASMGNVGALRRLGIDVQKVTVNTDALKAAHLGSNVELAKHAKALDLAATKTEVMRQVTQKFSGASAAYMKTFAGESARLHNVVHDLFVELGNKAIPILTALIAKILQGIDAFKNSERAMHGLHVVGEGLKLMWLGVTTIFEGFVAMMRNKVLRVFPLLIAAWAAVTIAMDLNPFVAAAAAALLAVGLIRKHWSAIAGFFRDLWARVAAIFKLYWDVLKMEAVVAVLAIIEPFSHLPGGMGKWARKMKDSLHESLNNMVTDAKTQGSIIGHGAGKAMVDSFQPFALQLQSQMLGVGGPGAPGNPNARAQAGGTQFGLVTKAKQLGVGSGGIYVKGGGHSGIAKPGQVFDCSGYIYQVFTQNGFKSFPGVSETQWSVDSGPNWTSEHITVGAAKPGDVVFMVGSGYVSPGHVGIVTDGAGSGATIMEYYQSGKPAAGNRKLGQIGDIVGIKRFYLVVKGAAASAAAPTKPAASAPKASAAFQAQIDAAKAAATATKAAKAGLKDQSLTGIQGRIDAELRAVPKQTDAVEKEAIRHIKSLRDRLHVGMSQSELAKDKVELAKWGKVLKDEIGKNSKAAAKHAQAEAKKVADAAREAAARWADAWARDEGKIGRAITEVWQAVQKKWDRETTAHLNQMQRDSQVGLTKLQRAFAAQMTAFDRETKRGLDALGVPQTAAEKALADFEAGRQSTADAKAAADRQSRLATAQGDYNALQSIGVGGLDANGNIVDQAAIKNALDNVTAVQEEINQAALDAQDVGLKQAADASRVAADKSTADAQQAYQDQRDALQQSLQDQQALLEQSFTDKAQIAQTAYQDMRDAQWQSQQDLHDDAVTNFNADLKTWSGWLDTKQKSWKEFLAWLQRNPLSKGFDGSTIENPSTVGPGLIGAAIAGSIPSNQVVPRGGGRFIPMAKGGDVMVDKPTLFLAGEAGRERARFTPVGAGGGGDGSNINVYINAGHVTDRDELVDMVRRELLALGRQNGAKTGSIFGGRA